MHELLHVLGFRHEQNRRPRQVREDHLVQYQPTSFAGTSSKNCGLGEDLGEYDGASIMHYSDTAFRVKRGVNGALLKTIQSVAAGATSWASSTASARLTCARST
jgi:hypothetical protein